jgi:hypothetical protein
MSNQALGVVVQSVRWRQQLQRPKLSTPQSPDTSPSCYTATTTPAPANPPRLHAPPPPPQ